MKHFLRLMISLLVIIPLALSPSLASAHGGDGGDGGGGGDSGGDGDGGGRANSGNAEKTSPPSGFTQTKSAQRNFSPAPSPIPTQMLLALQAKGYVSEKSQTESGNSNWTSRASQPTQQQWEKHAATAYDVAAFNGGITLADRNAMGATVTTQGVSPALAGQVWSMATQLSLSSGQGLTHGLGANKAFNAALSRHRSQVALKNLVKE